MFSPGSTTKLYTGAAALDVIGLIIGSRLLYMPAVM